MRAAVDGERDEADGRGDAEGETAREEAADDERGREAQVLEAIDEAALLLGNTTPHNEYLLLLVQGGLVAWACLLLLVACALRGVFRHRRAAIPAVLVLTAMAWAALFNVVLRDSKFALPLLTLSALGWAASTIHRPVPAVARAGVSYQAP